MNQITDAQVTARIQAYLTALMRRLPGAFDPGREPICTSRGSGAALCYMLDLERLQLGEPQLSNDQINLLRLKYIARRCTYQAIKGSGGADIGGAHKPRALKTNEIAAHLGRTPRQIRRAVQKAREQVKQGMENELQRRAA